MSDSGGGRCSLKRQLSAGSSAASSKAADEPAVKRPQPAVVRGGWQVGLKSAMADASQTLFSDSSCVIIADKYPKARHHYLVMPNRQIDSLTRVTRGDAPLLRHLLSVAKEFVSGKNLEESAFRFGFHAVPSMSQLHMHVISQDFVSPSLKTKKHWLSFTTKFFIDCESLLLTLESADIDNQPLAPRVTLKHDGELLAIDKVWFSGLIKDGKLKCNQCARVCKNMPDLKTHLSWHQK